MAGGGRGPRRDGPERLIAVLCALRDTARSGGRRISVAPRLSREGRVTIGTPGGGSGEVVLRIVDDRGWHVRLSVRGRCADWPVTSGGGGWVGATVGPYRTEAAARAALARAADIVWDGAWSAALEQLAEREAGKLATARFGLEQAGLSVAEATEAAAAGWRGVPPTDWDLQGQPGGIRCGADLWRRHGGGWRHEASYGPDARGDLGYQPVAHGVVVVAPWQTA